MARNLVQNNSSPPGISEINFIDLSHDTETIDDTLGNCKNKTINNYKKRGKGTPRKVPRKSPTSRVFRALRSFSQQHFIDKPNDESTNIAHPKIRRKKAKKRKAKLREDEFSKLRKHLKYLLQRLQYERNVIDVCSGEGWNGKSSDKIKLEQELERAKTDIFRHKVKIRETFKRLYLLCSNGKLPESLFDSDGQIDSEDIFCAKCFSKELSLRNDIILCDGVCDRGFHQFCLEPPMFKIPTGDDGWLCPGCDCKIDCFDIFNEYEGTNLSVDDSWEMVFPETMSTMPLGDNLGLLSDDSDDNDYDPDAPKVGGDSEGGLESVSASSSSDFTSASESDDLEVVKENDKTMGSSSDDVEDNDYDPDAPDVDEVTKPESSKSDFTSDSEDLNAIFEDGKNVATSSLDHEKHHSVSDTDCVIVSGPGELGGYMLSKEDGCIDEGYCIPASHKRLMERPDYKKLYDETYGNIPSSSSDDEDWAGADSSVKRGADKASSKSPNVDSIVPLSSINCDHENSSKSMQIVTQEASSGPGSSINGSGKRKRLSLFIKQELARYILETQYPDKQKKEQIAEHLGITVYQVEKWFEHSRWLTRSIDGKTRTRRKKMTEVKTEPAVSCTSSGGNTRVLRRKKKEAETTGEKQTAQSPNCFTQVGANEKEINPPE